MSLSAYGAFLGFAIVLVLIPGPDFAVVTKNTLAGGHCRGRWTAFGVVSSNIYLLGLTAGLRRARQLLLRRKVRRTLDGATAAALLGFSARLAAEHA